MHINHWKPKKFKPVCSAHYDCSASKKLCFFYPGQGTANFQCGVTLLSFCQQEQKMRGLG